MLIVGIDLGTTASVIAFMQHGAPRSITVDVGKNTTPSVVNYEDSGIVVGREAIYRMDPAHSVFGIKRFMGTNKKFFGRSPEEISADILFYLKQSAEITLRTSIDAAVITVPAHFSDAQRIATKRAASIIGLKVLRLINEPTAAALAFGLDKKKNGVFAIYDLGGGTFDFSILRLANGVFQVLATGGDNYLGGNDVDDSILLFNLSNYGLDIAQLNEGEKMLGRLVAKSLKENLGNEKEVKKNYIYKNKNYEFRLSNVIMRNIAQIYLNRTLKIADQVFLDAGITSQDIDGIIAVGGMTKMSIIKETVRNHFNVDVFDEINPEEAVAHGAAIHADSIAFKKKSMLLIDVVPLTLGIETLGGSVDRIVHRNTAVPIVQRREYTTHKNGQNGIKFHVVQGERPLAKDCRSLANFELTNIPKMPAGVPRIVVEFSVDVNGILNVTASEKSTGVAQSVLVEPSEGLSSEDMASILENATKNRENDTLEMAHVFLKVESERMINFWESLINEIPNEYKNFVRSETELLKKASAAEDFPQMAVHKKNIENISGQFLDEIISARLSQKIIEDKRELA
ncbi:MAG: Hsp70 family protein [Holosporaceae bacterium]|jgi:molecular chaperone DnaK (HSP70)|nr:Hsp70 family protein [Holosporaceae bacterium]